MLSPETRLVGHQQRQISLDSVALPLRVGAAVDGKARAGDVVSLRARYEGARRSDVVDVALALERCGLEVGLGPLVG
jgi:hypothetical protein